MGQMKDLYIVNLDKTELSTLEQRENESIAEYLNRANGLAVRLGKDDAGVGMHVLNGMRDFPTRERINNICHKERRYSLNNVLNMSRPLTARLNLEERPLDNDGGVMA